MIAPARIAAYEALTAVTSGRADLPTAIAHARQTLKDERDRALATDMATGVQRWRAALDHVIAHVARRNVDRLDPEVLEILRVAAYQLLHLTRVPASAAVDDAVALTKRFRKKSAAGFVNAVLRAISRQRDHLPLPARPAEADRERALAYLSVTLSHPRWLAARWYDRLGFERAEAWMRFNNQPSPLTLRANPFRTSPSALRDRLAAHGITTRAGAYAPASLVVEEGNPLTLHDEDIVGHFMVQDEASQLVPLLAGEHTGARVLDACASPGGKAVTLAAAMPAGGLLIACDVRDRRMALLRRTIDRTLARHVCLVQADLLALLPFRSVFSTVIVDAPCSGLGTLRRDPDIRWRRQASDLATLADAQSVMLDRAAQVVAPGGRLIYATCSTEPEENEQVVDALLQRSTDLRQLDARSTHPLLSPTLVDERGCLRTSPDVHQLEGFFGAVFEKRAAL